MSRILVADDHDALRRGLSLALGAAGHEVEEASNGNAALEKLHEGYFDIVVTDLKMGGSTGIDVLRTTKTLHPSASVILMTAFGSVGTAVEAMKHGAFDYVQKPFEIEEMEVKVEKALELKRLKYELDYLRNEQQESYNFDRIIGASEPLENLLESELFGHEKGAFTGADRQRIGRLEQADGGTLFLDEIGDMSASTQAKILRVLQEHEFERLGGTRTIKVDVRLIAATNRPLPAMVAQGQFREDLYYRLNIVTIDMPPLRERKDDIIPLSMWFVRRFSNELKKKLNGFDSEAQKMLVRYNWPGIIRELENAVERAALLAEGSLIKGEDLRLGDLASSSGNPDAATVVKIPPTGIALEEIERQALLEALKMSNWVQKDAAELLNISPRVMNYKIKTLNIEMPRRRLVSA